jgi:hypothetical protein
MGFYDLDNTPRSAEALYPEAHVLDLREEMDHILFGSFDMPGVGRPLLIRFIQDTHCACWDSATGSPNPHCGFCQGEGYQFTEQPTVGYIARNFGGVQNPSTVISQQSALDTYGYTDAQRALVFLRYDTFPNYERYMRPDHPAYDKLYELKVDDSGTAVFPVVRAAKWRIKSVTPHHGDGGRIEYFEIGAEKENL